MVRGGRPPPADIATISRSSTIWTIGGGYDAALRLDGTSAKRGINGSGWLRLSDALPGSTRIREGGYASVCCEECSLA